MSAPERDQEIEEAMAEFIRQREDSFQHGHTAPSPRAFAGRYPDLGPQLEDALVRLAETEELFVPDEQHMPRRIGPYHVLGELGRGGMGRVLRVHHESDPERVYALKLLGLSAQLNPRLVKRFEREASCIKGLEHPGIVRVHDFGPLESEPYLIMDIVEGSNLALVLAAAREAKQSASEQERRRVPSAQFLQLGSGEANAGLRAVAALVAKLAQATEVLHASGIVHRDIKPSNVVVQADGQPVLIDFGLASDEDSSTLTHTGDLLGTPHYMAPEQARGERLDHRVDVYAIGAILHELLCLAQPHADGTSSSDPILLLDAIRKQPVRSIRKREPQVPVALARILERALAFRREKRYASAAQLAEDLEAFLDGRPILARSMFLERCVLGARRHRASLLSAAALLLLAFLWLPLEPRTSQAMDPERALRQATDRAAMAWGLDDLEETRRAAEEMLALDPGNITAEFLLVISTGEIPPDSDDPSIEALIYGMQRYEEGRMREARADFRRAAKFNPDSPLPVVMGAKIAALESELEEQELELVAALERDPESAALSRELGRVYYELERYPESVEALQRAVDNDPEYVRTYYDLARAQAPIEGYAAGLRTAQEASRKFGRPGDVVLRHYCGLLMTEKQYELAREALLGIADRHADEAQFCLDIARTYDYAEELSDALYWYQKALELDAEHYDSLKGLFHLRAGANRDTCEACVEAFALDPEMFNPDEAALLGARLLKLDGGKNLGLTLWVVQKLAHVEREFEVEACLVEMLEEPRSQKAEENLERALAKLQDADF